MKRVKFSFKTTFGSSKNAALAAKYLNSEEIDQAAEIEFALCCLFAPVGAATEGASAEEVENLIKISRAQFETYMNLALCQLEHHLDIRPVQKNLDATLEDEEKEVEIGICFDDEEF